MFNTPLSVAGSGVVCGELEAAPWYPPPDSLATSSAGAAAAGVSWPCPKEFPFADTKPASWLCCESSDRKHAHMHAHAHTRMRTHACARSAPMRSPSSQLGYTFSNLFFTACGQSPSSSPCHLSSPESASLRLQTTTARTPSACGAYPDRFAWTAPCVLGLAAAPKPCARRPARPLPCK